MSDCNRDFTAALSDCLAGFSVVKSFKAEKEIFELFARSNRALEKEKFGRERIVTIVGMIGAITAIFAQLGVFIAGAYFSLNGYGLTPGAVILFVNLMNFTIEPIASLPGLRIEDFCSCISFFAANFFHRRCIFRRNAKS